MFSNIHRTHSYYVLMLSLRYESSLSFFPSFHLPSISSVHASIERFCHSKTKKRMFYFKIEIYYTHTCQHPQNKCSLEACRCQQSQGHWHACLLACFWHISSGIIGRSFDDQSYSLHTEGDDDDDNDVDTTADDDVATGGGTDASDSVPPGISKLMGEHKLDSCNVQVYPPLNPDHEYFRVPSNMMAHLEIRHKETKNGIIIFGLYIAHFFLWLFC